MSVTQIIEETDRLPEADQRLVAEHLRQHFAVHSPGAGQPVLRHRSFEEAQERVFRENRELLRLLAQ